MIPAMKAYYEGWEICTACWDELVDANHDSLTQYCASGYATLVQPKTYAGGWLSKVRQTVPANKDMLFSDFNVAHVTIAAVLRSQIDALKVR